jgi:hypothetical protein
MGTETSDIATIQQPPALRELSLSNAIDIAVAKLTVAAPQDCVLEQLLFVESLKSIAADAYSRVRDAAARWIIANDEIESNGIRYYVGDKKTTKCKDKAKTLEALLVHCAGDMAQVAEFMSSEPFKHGAISKELPPVEYAALFVVFVEPELREGKPKLQKVDTKFLK